MGVIEPGLCMADAPQACSCGRCNLRSQLTNAGVASIEVERDRALSHLEGAVEALETIRDWPMPTGNSSCAGVIERMQLLARQTVGGQYEASPAHPSSQLGSGTEPNKED